MNQRCSTPSAPAANARSREEYPARGSPATRGSLGLEKGDVIVAGRFQKASPMGNRQSGLRSVALGQWEQSRRGLVVVIDPMENREGVRGGVASTVTNWKEGAEPGSCQV